MLSLTIPNAASCQIIEDRKLCLELPRTGLAEYLDLLRALDELGGDRSAADKWLKRLGKYFRKSQVNQDRA